MKRVLFLAYLFPPIANSGTLRPLKFVRFLAEHGWDPIVVTAAHFDGHPTDPELLREIPDGVRVVRVPMLNERIGDGIATALGRGALARRIGDSVKWRLRERRRSPDLYAWWQPTAIRAARRIFREDGFDAIYATGHPWTSLMVGRAIARTTGRPFVADFRDLWADELLFRDEPRPPLDERALERQVIESASAVVCATETMIPFLANAHPTASSGKFIAIHNGFDPADLDIVAAAKDPATFRIVYTGVWKDGYNASALYDAIDWLKRSQPEALDGIEVVAAGFEPGEARRRGLTAHIKEAGFLPHHEAVALMRSADLLYLSAVDDPKRQWGVPSKLYEYLASGTPVLASAPSGSETDRIVKRVGGARLVPPNEPRTLNNALLDACRTKSFTAPPIDADALRGFERRQLAGRLSDVLNDASGCVVRPEAA